MANEANKIRKKTWYLNYKLLAENIKDLTLPNILRAVHGFLDGNNKYGSIAVANSAGKSLEQVIKDLQLEEKNGIIARLGNMTVKAYGSTIKLQDLLSALTDEEIANVFSGIYEGLLQEGILSKNTCDTCVYKDTCEITGDIVRLCDSYAEANTKGGEN